MSIKFLIFSFIGLSFFIFIIELLRSHKMREKYSIVWLIIGILVFIMPLSYNLWSRFARFIGLADPNALMFILGFLGLGLLALQFSLALSSSSSVIKEIVQHIALLEHKIEELEKKIDK
ncbi:MAG: DUF2304 domain-containing protein [Candidatus Firestonebacteria bacterium]